MKTLKLAGKTIEVYDDIENLPVTRFHKYNKMLLVDAGIGSDIADFDKHISRIAAFWQRMTISRLLQSLKIYAKMCTLFNRAYRREIWPLPYWLKA